MLWSAMQIQSQLIDKAYQPDPSEQYRRRAKRSSIVAYVMPAKFQCSIDWPKKTNKPDHRSLITRLTSPPPVCVCVTLCVRARAFLLISTCRDGYVVLVYRCDTSSIGDLCKLRPLRVCELAEHNGEDMCAGQPLFAIAAERKSFSPLLLIN